MLDQKTIDIVKSTAPVLDQHGETLTRHFYQRMFTHNPEVAPFFNPAHQKSGSQQRALAAAICAYAANIDNLEVLGNAVELIAQKHASLHIKPEHYPIVGENLLASIREVLGDAATDDIINAWANAYGFLANILINREAQIYKDNATMPGGWDGFKTFHVMRKERESSIITSLYLTPQDGSALPAFKAGQYITIRMPTPNGSTTMRNYSLSDKPGNDYFRISVKRETPPEANTPAGYVSNMLHDSVNVGDTVELSAPCGEFFFDPSEHHARPLVLLAAGIGITPLMSILLTALDAHKNRDIFLIHGCLDTDVQPFKSTLDKLAQTHSNLHIHYRYSDMKPADIQNAAHSSTGFVDAALIESIIPGRDADYYFCGPKIFMVNIYHQLLDWGIPASQVHFEFFGPRQELDKKAA